MKKIALITGISGQDGSYLANFLLKKNYKVIGTDRRSSRDDRWRLRYFGIENKIIIEDMDLSEITQMIRVFNKYKINEVYNLGAQSFVGTSFSNPVTTCDITGMGCLRLLEVIRSLKYKLNFYQASSSEMFGEVLETPQTEKTPFNPRSPYAIAKIFSHYICTNYREAYKMFIVSGICFNHESPLRGEEFVTRKITSSLAKIEHGHIKYFELGNIFAKRDWGFAGDYVEGMWKSLQVSKPDDYIFSTNVTKSIKEFIDESVKYLSFKTYWEFKKGKMQLYKKGSNIPIIRINARYYRPTEVDNLIGSNKKAKKILNWKPRVNFKDLAKMMMQEDLKRFQNNY